MNINITNYPVHSNNYGTNKNKKLNNISKYSFVTVNGKMNQAPSVNFTGLPRFLMKRQTREGIRDYLSRTSYCVGVSPKKLQNDFSIKTLADSAVLYRLAEKYRKHGDNFLNYDNAYKVISNIYSKIKKPTMELNFILKISRKSLDDFSNIFDAIGNDKNKLKLFYQLNSLTDKQGAKLSVKTDDFIKLLSSDKSKKLSKNFDKYRSYIELTHGNDDFSEKLLQEIDLSKPSFSEKEIQKKLEFRFAKSKSLLFDYLPEKFLEDNYNPLAYKLFSNFKCAKDNLLPNGENVTEKDLEFFKYILNTTNKKNIKERTSFFNNDINIRISKNSKDEIVELFQKIDSDKNFKKLYNKITSDRIQQEVPIRELLLYVDTFGSKKLLKNSDNFIRILRYSDIDKKDPMSIIKSISKNINNKFYITKREIQGQIEQEYFTRNKYLFTGNLRANFQRVKRILMHGTFPKVFGKGKEIPVDMQAVQLKVDKLNIAKAEREQFIKELYAKRTTTSYSVVSPQQTVKTAVVAEEKAPTIQTVEKTVDTQDIGKVQRKIVKRDYKAERLRIKQEAMDIIRAKIRSKNDYSAGIKRFTKMRNALLPDMFASVKETRAQQRSQGIKRPKVSNKDVITLYERIHGKNRRLIKYLLNRRTADGNREFDVRQITTMLDDIESPIKNVNSK